MISSCSTVVNSAVASKPKGPGSNLVNTKFNLLLTKTTKEPVRNGPLLQLYYQNFALKMPKKHQFKNGGKRTLCLAFQFRNNILDATTADRSSTRKAENIGKAKMEIWSDYYSLHMIYEGMVGNNNVKNI